MKSLFKKIFLVVSFVFLYLTIKEFLQLYTYLSGINEILAIAVITLLVVIILYFGILPIIQIILLPTSLGPTKDKSKLDTLLEKRIKKLRGNQYLKETNFDFKAIRNNHQSYEKIIEAIKPEAQRIRKKHVNSVFYGTAISQNGFLDSVIVLSAAVNLVKEIFILYNGRVSHKDLIVIWRNVYYSIVISGSDGVEYATEEVYSKLATDSMKSIPFFDKIFGSLTDGYVNAALLTRISLITENYCTKIYITKQKELFPKSTFVLNTAKELTNDLIATIKSNLLKMTHKKTEDYLKKAINPVSELFDKSYNKIRDFRTRERSQSRLKEGLSRINIFTKSKNRLNG